jgi:uncharacterized protein (TIGR00369 family)
VSPAEIQAIVHAGVPLAAQWGIEVLQAEGGTALCRLPERPDLLRPGGSIAGPALMGLADVAMWAALLGVNEGRDESLTSQLAISFLRRPRPGPVLAEARIVKQGGRLIYGEVWLRAEAAAEPAAHVTTQWVVVTPPRR